MTYAIYARFLSAFGKPPETSSQGTCPLCQGTCLLPTYHMSSMSRYMSTSYLPHVLYVKVHVHFLPTPCPLCQGTCPLPTYHMSPVSRYMSSSYQPHVLFVKVSVFIL